MTWPLGTVYLNVTDLRRSVAFYQAVIGLQVQQEDGDTVLLGAPGAQTALLALTQQPEGQPSSGGTGLYHFAILLPTRRDLARVLLHFSQTQTPVQGLSDHFVSEAIYLDDPDGNGIEIYSDRPREAWEYPGGQLSIGTVALNVDNLVAELKDHAEPWQHVPPGTIMGHVHLHVNDLAATQHFYGDLLGLDLMMKYGNAALFMSWEGYHHHLGLNTWRRGAPSAIQPDTLGLRWFTINLGAARAGVLARLDEAGIPQEAHPGGTLVHDPAGNGLLLA